VKSGSADLPLHGGHCPPWLFEKMKSLGTAIVQSIILEFDRREVIRRLSDPCWFHALGCTLGFDWHSSGLTTVLCGALKEGLNPRAEELGLFVAGGKGATSRKTPHELAEYAGEHDLDLPVAILRRNSKLAASVDSAALQDGYQIYHHNFIVTRDGDWCVVQQGMNDEEGWARRYHWLSDDLDSFVEQPHSGVCSDETHDPFNLTHPDSETNRSKSVSLLEEPPDTVMTEYNRLIDVWDEDKQSLNLPSRHDVPRATHLESVVQKLYEQPLDDFEDLLERDGVGPKTVRALSMVAEVIWGASPSFEDPARYAFAHGGKDGHPFPVRKKRYDETTRFLGEMLNESDIGRTDKRKAMKRLAKLRKTVKSA
jgi:hypothetical protein